VFSQSKGREMAKTSSAPRRNGLHCDRLPFRWAALLIAILGIASWAAVIGVVRLVWLAIRNLVGI